MSLYIFQSTKFHLTVKMKDFNMAKAGVRLPDYEPWGP